RITVAMDDWMNARVGFRLEERDGATQVRFHHTGWPEASEHYRISSFCWAMYLRLLKRYVEFGEVVPYDQRLDV
ncbi:MAG TPA: SRPBCC domain-containing protein, partial [Blastocatellia bacterium]|nr:SRPBCC domain-containing protein [Blastocatellia bacterium]